MMTKKWIVSLVAIWAASVGCQKSADQDKATDVAIMSSKAVQTAPAIEGPQIAMENVAVSFSLSVPAGVTIASAQWNLGDGTQASGLGPITHSYSISDVYNLSVTLTTASGEVSQLTQKVQVVGGQDGYECVIDAKLNVPSEGTVGVAVLMGLPYPPCIANEIKSVSFDFGDGTPQVSGDGKNVQHVYAAAGSYVVTAHVFAKTGDAKWFELKETIVISDATNPTPTPTPHPMACPASGQTRESLGATYTVDVACGRDGKKTNTMQYKIKEECAVDGGTLIWKEVSRESILKEEGQCMGQSCVLPDGSKLADGQSKVLYSSQTPAGSCAEVSQTRSCSNGVLSGSDTHKYLTCAAGCPGFGTDGTVKTGLVVGEITVPVSCEFGEQGINSIFDQIADKTCTAGQVVTSNVRQGSLKTAGLCPTYAWSGTATYGACSAACGGQQARVFECRNDKGEVVSSDRCKVAMPVETRVCDGNPESVRRTETATSQEEGASTNVCPANQIGVVVNIRDVTTTKTYACIDHKVQLESTKVSNGPWVKESYCRDYVAARCSKDSLDNGQAEARYKWMLKCQDQVPQIKEFLENFEDVKTKLGSLEGKGRRLYATFMNHATNPEKPWIAPKNANASCDVPETAYIAAVCVSSCSTPEQEILVKARAEHKMRWMPFIDAYSSKEPSVATMTKGSSINSKAMKASKVDQWVTEIVDADHELVNFKMKSGQTLRMTLNHPMVAADGTMKLASDFKVGDSLVKFGGELDEIVSNDREQYYGKVYNLFVKSEKPEENIVSTKGYLNGTAFFQNEGAGHVNKLVLRSKLIKGAIK